MCYYCIDFAVVVEGLPNQGDTIGTLVYNNSSDDKTPTAQLILSDEAVSSAVASSRGS